MASGYPDFEGDKSKVYLTPEWSTIDGTDKTLTIDQDNCAHGSGGQNLYTVPAGKTLYITGFSAESVATAAADYDHFLYISAAIVNNTDVAVLAQMGGVGGCGISFPTPRVLTAGKQLKAQLLNESNVNCDVAMTVWGYEL